MHDSDEWTIAGVILAGLSLIVSIAGFAQPEIRRCVGLDPGDCPFGNTNGALIIRYLEQSLKNAGKR